jgi:predicted NAD/FAD-binding protein
MRDPVRGRRLPRRPHQHRRRDAGRRSHPVDTGFLVFNEKTYPNLIAMFALLGVDSVETEMSFAVSLENPDLEWAGSNLATIFGQKRNLLRRLLGHAVRHPALQPRSTAWLLSHPNDQRPATS